MNKKIVFWVALYLVLATVFLVDAFGPGQLLRVSREKQRDALFQQFQRAETRTQQVTILAQLARLKANFVLHQQQGIIIGKNQAAASQLLDYNECGALADAIFFAETILKFYDYLGDGFGEGSVDYRAISPQDWALIERGINSIQPFLDGGCTRFL